jgi:hypothetical protein
MHAEKVAILARHVEPDDIVVVECDGYELTPYAVEYDEWEGVLKIKCWSADDEPPEDDDDDEESCAEVCALPEKASDVEQVDPEPVEG